ncbi:peptidoglycan bridge formation glycyltransferase FemA/FemB family protein [Treponema sp.]
MVYAEKKTPEKLLSTPILHQSALWSRIKTQLGWGAEAFDFSAEGEEGDLLLMIHQVSTDKTVAYAPYGPELLPDDDSRGNFLEELSETLKEQLPDDCICIRWDLPWKSPYAEDASWFDEKGQWQGPPSSQLQELRMNAGTLRKNLLKAPSDILPTDTLFLDLSEEAAEILKSMKSKTRYNILLAARKGIHVREGTEKDLGIWMELYRETASRNGIVSHEEFFFEPLFEAGSGKQGRGDTVKLLIAERDGIAYAAMFLALGSGRATYLYGASSSKDTSLMAPYALQWAAIQEARAFGCKDYDFFGVAPSHAPSHPLSGLSRFKTGFGGALFHRQGCWDYPLDKEIYPSFARSQLIEGGFHLR